MLISGLGRAILCKELRSRACLLTESRGIRSRGIRKSGVPGGFCQATSAGLSLPAGYRGNRRRPVSDNQDSIGAFRYQRHEPRIPALREGVETRVWPVAIVGGGPVGLALALGLADHGVRSVVLEADDTVCIGSRAACISRRSLEIVDRLGALPAFLAKGLRLDRRPQLLQDHGGLPLRDAARRAPAAAADDQPAAVLHRAIPGRCHRAPQRDATGPLIDLRWASEVTGVAANAGGVDITVRNRLGHYRTMAQWLVACDGGQSLVRKWLGPRARRHSLRGPLRDHRHPPAERPPDRTPRLVRPAVEPGARPC